MKRELSTSLLTAPVHIQAMADNAIPEASDLWRIAIDHRKTYMALSKSAAAKLAPIVKYYIEAGMFTEAASFVTDIYPDTIEKTLALQSIFSAEDKASKELNP